MSCPLYLEAFTGHQSSFWPFVANYSARQMVKMSAEQGQCMDPLPPRWSCLFVIPLWVYIGLYCMTTPFLATPVAFIFKKTSLILLHNSIPFGYCHRDGHVRVLTDPLVLVPNERTDLPPNWWHLVFHLGSISCINSYAGKTNRKRWIPAGPKCSPDKNVGCD